MIPQHILVPVDFSEHADQALNYALELAGKLGARLTLLHVIERPVASARGLRVSLDPYFQQVELMASETMNDYARRVHEAGLEYGVAIAHGEPFQQIIDLASSKQVDLIVMGTHGRTGLQHFLLGSVGKSGATGTMPGVSHAPSDSHAHGVKAVWGAAWVRRGFKPCSPSLTHDESDDRLRIVDRGRPCDDATDPSTFQMIPSGIKMR